MERRYIPLSITLVTAKFTRYRRKTYENKKINYSDTARYGNISLGSEVFCYFGGFVNDRFVIKEQID